MLIKIDKYYIEALTIHGIGYEDYWNDNKKEERPVVNYIDCNGKWSYIFVHDESVDDLAKRINEAKKEAGNDYITARKSEKPEVRIINNSDENYEAGARFIAGHP